MRQPQRWILLVLMVLSVRAWADDRAEAKSHYQAGVKLYAGADYKRAAELEAQKKADEAKKRPPPPGELGNTTGPVDVGPGAGMGVGAGAGAAAGSTGTPGSGQIVSTGDAQLDRVQGIDVSSIRD